MELEAAVANHEALLAEALQHAEALKGNWVKRNHHQCLELVAKAWH